MFPEVHQYVSPDWGQRRGNYRNGDWQTYTPLEMCLQVDSLNALAEIYGMSAIARENIFIGFPHIYTGFPQLQNKVCGGTMHVELSYSLNGRHWQRSLRTPFLSANILIDRARRRSCKMLYVNSVLMQRTVIAFVCHDHVMNTAIRLKRWFWRYKRQHFPFTQRRFINEYSR